MHAHPRAWAFKIGCGILMQIITAQALWAAPVRGKQFHLPQPDGTWIDVRIWGDEYYGVTETLDGYTLVRDPQTLFFCYADLTPDGNDLVSTGVPAGAALPRGLSAHLRIAQPAAYAQAQAARERWQAERVRGLGARGQPRAVTTGNVAGICLIVDFSDDVGTIPPATVSNYCNQVGYTGYGNNGSVRDYFYDVSDGLLTYTNYVSAAYYRAAHPKSYYTDPNISYGQRAQELIVEALTYLDSHGLDFSQYDSDNDGVIDAVNCFYAGNVWNNWAEGLWPHSWYVDFCADGVCTGNYQISDMGSNLYLGTFCHENGHMLMNWPDLYDYDYDSTGVGQFCLMAYGTTDTNPCEPSAAMKYFAGWTRTTLLTVPQTRLIVPASNVNRFYKFEHPTLANEYYLIENRQKTGRDAGLPDAGLAIWHIDTLGSNNNNQMTPELHFLVTLVQADGRWDLEHDVNYGDTTDLWASPEYTQCTPATSPNTNWWAGGASGLSVTGISASANWMTFDYSGPARPMSIVAWGDNSSAQCDVPAPDAGFVAVAGGYEHSLGLTAGGSIVAWGSNAAGQCDIPLHNAGYVGVAGGYTHSLGVKAGGSISAWGDNSCGQLIVPAPNTGFVAVAAGYFHSLGLKAGGSVVAWGLNGSGQCNVPVPNTGFIAVAGGNNHSLGLKADGSIAAWGDNGYGQCNVPGPNAGFVAIAAGNAHSLGLKADGSVVAMGWDAFGQCAVPAPNTDFVAIGAGDTYSLGLKSDGSIVTWGANSAGQCDVPSPNSGFVGVAGGLRHGLGLKAYSRGDLNCDGVLSFKDINPFVQYLSNFSAWQVAYPTCPPDVGDINQDGTYPAFKDINPFVALLSS